MNTTQTARDTRIIRTRRILNAFKPYQLAYVQAGDYQYIGQVMSRETPDGTYMVRRAPGHPGTLDEVSADKLATLHTGKQVFVHYAIVAGRGSFPIDMLRYDQAAPVNFTLDRSHAGGAGCKAVLLDGMGDDLIIAQTSTSIRPNWTSARWSSFLWSVRPLQSERLGVE